MVVPMVEAMTALRSAECSMVSVSMVVAVTMAVISGTVAPLARGKIAGGWFGSTSSVTFVDIHAGVRISR